MRTRLVLLTTMALVVLVGGMLVAAAAGGPPRTETAPVTWHAQAAEEGEVEGAQARLRATNAGASITVQTRGLERGHAYTLWLVLVDNPEACDSEPCTPPEILTDADVGGQVLYGDGNVVGDSGRATFSAHVNAGSVEGWLANRQLTDPRVAEYHVVINDHGPKLSEHMPDMIRTYRGGCSDDSPFPGIFPESALADGEPGPNSCLLSQLAIFQP